MPKRLTPEQGLERCRLRAKGMGGKFLGKTWTGVLSKYRWECERGHRWLGSADAVVNKSWCPQCAIVGRTTDLEIQNERWKTLKVTVDFKSVKSSVTVATKIWGICQVCKSKTFVSLNVAESKGHGPCKFCSRRKMGSVNFKNREGHKFINAFGVITCVKWINTNKNGSSYYLFKCFCKKEFLGSINSIVSNHRVSCGCKRKGTSHQETELLNQLKKSFPDAYHAEDIIPVSLNKSKYLDLDIFIPSLNFAIEYDGPLHRMPFFGIETLSKIKRNDKEKTKYCKENGIKLIRITDTAYVKNPEKALSKILTKINKHLA